MARPVVRLLRAGGAALLRELPRLLLLLLPLALALRLLQRAPPLQLLRLCLEELRQEQV